MTVRFLFDTSAVVRVIRNREVAGQWEPHICAGVAGLCRINELELLYSARSKADREEQLALFAATFAWVAVPDRVFTRATEVQAGLTERGKHRSTGVVDLLVAATAELNRLTLVHYDSDFDEVVNITAQPALWLAPRGTIA